MSNIVGEYDKLCDCYGIALDEVEKFVNKNLLSFCSGKYVYYMKNSRIKSEKSITRKMEEKKKTFDSLCDIAGIRIVFCSLEDVMDLDTLDQEIHGWQKDKFVIKFYDAVERYRNSYIDVIYDFRDFLSEQAYNTNFDVIIDEKKDYIKHPKESGYQSVHLIVTYDGIPVELQLRNLVQHYFAEYEHKYYKDDTYTRSEYNPICNVCADTLSNISSDYSGESLAKTYKIG